MIDFSQIMGRVVIAMILGAMMGLERELAGKEAGVRTEMLVSGGSALFTLAALSIPSILATNPQTLETMLTNNGGFLMIIGNIVVGVGFLGAGMIIKSSEHVHGLTTAALVWTTAAIGILTALGMWEVAVTATVLFSGVLYLLRRLNVSERVDSVRN
ncbi:MAG: MgtC/SapB family protein [Patescibacteria group bacterium]